ncbi:uncharacterized protein BYT42DRAFT_543204 [Radiomyces spectabilis]|uniref:uncharacterized protein n=1 Tax=Radiomyces spectabilis TaxID=64574 RepID=UPI0022207A44|nr:uncharacterized protein BYT42DRAFT_543204 [Radiomyces spectabilis]KAI8391692.1 hypothetical protein BYT42DRAFT_543204 [Radiomyces spectabilis]
MWQQLFDVGGNDGQRRGMRSIIHKSAHYDKARQSYILPATSTGPWNKYTTGGNLSHSESLHLRDRPFSPFRGYYEKNDMYPGTEFDIFGSEETVLAVPLSPELAHDPFALCGDILDSEGSVEILPASQRKRSHDAADWEYMARLAKRKCTDSVPPLMSGIFLKPTAPSNTPANFFMPKADIDDSLNTRHLMYC